MSRKKSVAAVEAELVAAVGAVIFASGEPVKPAEIAGAFKDVDAAQVEAAIALLEEQYADNSAGLRLERIAGGVRLATRPEVAEWVRRFFRQRNRTRLTPAGLETLAIVAYRQPVTAPEIQAIRGKDPSAALKSLLDKKLLRILGKKKVVGSPLLYGTSKEFLVHFGLDSLADLPSMDEFDAFVGTIDGFDVSDDADLDEIANGAQETPDDDRDDVALATEAAPETAAPAQSTVEPAADAPKG